MKSKWRVYVLIKSKVAETTPFYLNETVRSNQNMMFWFKIISFWLMPGQKKKSQTMHRLAVFIVFFFWPHKKLAKYPSLESHLMLSHSSSKTKDMLPW
jgi:hypothetical protein